MAGPTTTTTTAIPSFYRVFFTIPDPLCALSGVYIFAFDPDTVLSSVNPGHPAHDPRQAFVFTQVAGHMLGIALLQVALLRYTADLVVWKLVQASILVVDLALLWATAQAYQSQGRLWDLSSWRWEDWVSVGITLTVAVARSAFLAELGFPKKKRAVADAGGKEK